MIEIRKVRKEKDKEIRKEKKEITPSRDKVVPDYNRDDNVGQFNHKWFVFCIS